MNDWPRISQNAVIEGRARADQSLVRSLTSMSSAGTPSTAARAVRASTPCRTSARDQRVWPTVDNR